MTSDMWRLTCDTWRIMNLHSKFQLPSSYGLGGKVINRPGGAGAVLHTASLLIHSFIKWSFSSKSLRYHESQTIRARELKLWENVSPSPCVTCHVSCVRCQVSHVTCHVSGVKMSHQNVSSKCQNEIYQVKTLNLNQCFPYIKQTLKYLLFLNFVVFLTIGRV